MRKRRSLKEIWERAEQVPTTINELKSKREKLFKRRKANKVARAARKRNR